MTHPVLADVLADARRAGSATGPRDLLAALAGINRPMDLLTSWDACETLCSSFSGEYSFIQLARVAGVRPCAADMEKWSALLRWMVEELTGWSPAGDPHQRTLAAVFVAGAMSDIDHELWKLLSNPFAANHHLVGILQAILRSCSVTIDVSQGTRSPISTKAAVERLAVANATKDWKGIDECLDGFGDYISASLLQAQATRILMRCGQNDLLSVISGIDEALLAVSFVNAVADEESCLTLAVACSSPYFEFAVLRSAVYRGGQPTLTVHGLDALLLKMSAEPSRWCTLMDVFNRYPVRYPRLQEALGAALAGVLLGAMESYIAAIQLNDVALNDVGRENVATCLRAFQARANRSQREAMWQLAYDRWSTWGFDRSDPSAHLQEIRASLLDYAVVGYAIECLGPKAAIQARTDIVTKALSLHQNWYGSSSEIITDWKRSLSLLQPFAHAEYVLANSQEDWLCKTRMYLPTDSQTDYLKLKYRMP
ncbi:hypothetical protein ABIB80_007925 [Bradyrhizobium sp. i1.15.2]|uniref:hypothetical protein n=1 Tax=Bradyrhizobium sp. i1.15.2 TaxID=3156362 RepID=UPI00339A1AA9